MKNWLHAPAFWYQRRGLLAYLLWPATWLYRVLHILHNSIARPAATQHNLVCIGNLTVGGAGKSPLVLDTALRLQAAGCSPVALCKGYGARLKAPQVVDLTRHDVEAVGDEALMLARTLPTWISHDRHAGAIALAQQELVLMDDGLQNPALRAGLKVAVIDADAGFGNGFLLPAGPLREPSASGLVRVDVIVLLFSRNQDHSAWQRYGKPVLRARLHNPVHSLDLSRKYLAFCGIARPEKFFASLQDLGVDVCVRQSFGDHYLYQAEDIEVLYDQAQQQQAILLTTLKDWVRLPAHWQERVQVLALELDWQTRSLADYILEHHLK